MPATSATEGGVRTLHLTNPLMRGPDVARAQQLLATSPFGDFRPGAIDGVFGLATAEAARRAKLALGYPERAIDEVCGPVLLSYLEGTVELPPGHRAHTYLLDGDNVRHGLSRDLGFTDADRVENIRRAAEVARLMVDAGLIVLVSFISPFRSERRMARSLLAEGEFFEVHVDVPLAVAEARDPKSLYRKARAGELVNFTGIDSPYEPPEQPELRLDTAATSAEECARRVIGLLERADVIATRR